MRISDWSSDVCSSDLPSRPSPAVTGTESRPNDHAPHDPRRHAEQPGAAAQSIDSLRRLLGVRARTVVPLPARGPVDRSRPGPDIATGVRPAETPLPKPADRRGAVSGQRVTVLLDLGGVRVI